MRKITSTYPLGQYLPQSGQLEMIGWDMYIE